LPHLLKRFIQNGRLTVIGHDGKSDVFGSGVDGPDVTIRLTDAKVERDLFFTNLESRYESLRDDPVAWSSIVHDRNIERGSIADRSPE
ncbi:MAG: hypothetical protein WCO31_03150, partial [Actinomycetes bacterium]